MSALDYRALIISFSMLATNAGASSDAGVEVNAGTYQVKITYNSADDTDRDISYVTMPRGLLFDLITLVQQEYSRVSSRQDRHWVDISFESSSIEFMEFDDDERVYKTIRSIPFGDDFVSPLKKELCLLIGDGRCAQLRNESTFLYQASVQLGVDYPNIILFGSFPSAQLDTRYVLRPGKTQDGKFIKRKVDRQSISKIFCELP